MDETNRDDALARVLELPIARALPGRRSRRFLMGPEVPDGAFAYRSGHSPSSRRSPG